MREAEDDLYMINGDWSGSKDELSHLPLSPPEKKENPS